MPAKGKCNAITASGSRCKNSAKLAGLCRIHLPRSKKLSPAEWAKLLKDAALAAGAIQGLVEELVRLWQSLPFGVGPTMPADYEYLQEKLEFSWNTEANTHKPGNHSGETVNWRMARDIYDRATELTRSPSSSVPEREIRSLEADLELLIDSLPPELREMLYKQLGGN